MINVKKKKKEKIEENTIMGKTSDLFKKIRDAKGILHAKTGKIKERNSMDITEAEILRRGGKNTQNYLKNLNDPNNHHGVITHLEPDTVECKVKWDLGSISMNKAG